MILIKDQSFLEKSQKYPHDLGAEKKTLNVIRMKVSDIAYRDDSEFPTSTKHAEHCKLLIGTKRADIQYRECRYFLYVPMISVDL